MQREGSLELACPAWYLYLIQTEQGTLYTGITTDVTRRLSQHLAGCGAKSLRGRGPLTIVYHSAVGDRSSALKLEYRVKRLSRQQKLQLVQKQPSDLTNWLSQ